MFIVSTMAVPWPPSLSFWITVLEWLWAAASSHVLSIDCMLQRHSSKVPLAMRKTLVDLGVPLLLLLTLFCLEVLLGLWGRYRWRGSSRQQQLMPPGHLVRMFTVALFLFYPAYVRTVLGLFACMPLDKEGSAGPGEELRAEGHWWVYDMNQQCGAGYHLRFALPLGVILFALLCVALPLFIFIFMYRHKDKLDQDYYKQRLSFLARSFKPKYCWWEAITVVETVLLCCCAAFAPMLGPYYQALMMIAAFAGMFVLLLVVHPHHDDLITRVALQGYGVLFFSTYFILTFLPFEGGLRPSQNYGTVIGVLVLLINVAHILFCIVMLIRAVKWSQAMTTAVTAAVTATTAVKKTASSALEAVTSVLSEMRSGSASSGSPFLKTMLSNRLSIRSVASVVSRQGGSGTSQRVPSQV